jgi:hypothetical protein
MDDIVFKLYETAATLALSSPPPVHLRAICDLYGIKIRRSSEKRKGVRHAFLFQTSEVSEIVLPDNGPNPRDFTAWDRFLIAHELGHYFLCQLKAPKPLGEREYWHTEKACDEFARRLLLPSKEVAQVVMVAGDSAVDLLNATLHLQTKWFVPWPVAAHEVAGATGAVHFFRLQAKEGRIRVSVSTLPNKGGTGSTISETSSLGALLLDLPQNCGKSERVPKDRLSDLKILSTAIEVAVCRAGINEFRVATRPA